jgi:hypothetical protein
MSNLVNNSFYGVIPENKMLDLNTIKTIDNKLKGKLLRSIGEAIKFDTGTPQGKIYIPKAEARSFLIKRDFHALYATNQQLENMMKNVLETSNLNAFFEEDESYFSAKSINEQCEVSLEEEKRHLISPLPIAHQGKKNHFWETRTVEYL